MVVNKRFIIFFTILFLLSRLLVLNKQAVFFDSQEYLTRLTDPNFSHALYSGHIPQHPGYILIFWPVYHVASVLRLDSVASILVVQTILALFGMWTFYQFIKMIDTKINAGVSVLMAMLLPIFWIANATIMIETTYVSFFLFSLYFIGLYLTRKDTSIVYLLVSSFCFGFALFTHLAVLLWLPLLIYLTFWHAKKKLIPVITSFSISIFLFSLLQGVLIAVAQQTDLLQAVVYLYSSRAGEHAQIPLNLIGFVRAMRNVIVPLLTNHSIGLVGVTFLALYKIFFRDRSRFIFGLLWVVPIILVYQWWDVVFFGRHALIAGFGLAYIVATFLKGKTLIALILYLLIFSLPAVTLLKKDIPYLLEANAVEKLPPGLLIETHFARTSVENHYSGKTIYVEEPGWNKVDLDSEIKLRLIRDEPVFISSQALSEPYGFYSGPYLHPLSLSYKNEFVLKKTIEQFTMEESVVINEEDNLAFYKVISVTPNLYPTVPLLTSSKRRINFFDPLVQLLMWVKPQI